MGSASVFRTLASLLQHRTTPDCIEHLLREMAFHVLRNYSLTQTGRVPTSGLRVKIMNTFIGRNADKERIIMQHGRHDEAVRFQAVVLLLSVGAVCLLCYYS